jgi:serine/threonine-protein phosphatase PP1 catalytic subunit
LTFYGRDVFEEFLKVNNLELMIRAHECFPEGYKWFFQYKLLSIFTSANYRGLISPNPATYAVIKSQNVQARIL